MRRQRLGLRLHLAALTLYCLVASVVSGASVALAASPLGDPPPPETAAQARAGKKKKKKKKWKTWVRFSAEGRYDDNLFLLSGAQEAALRNAGPAEAASGRFDDMTSVTDFIVTPAFSVKTRGPAAAGRRMTLKAKVGYHAYLQNSKRSYLETDFSIAQATSKNGRVRLKLDFFAEYFPKNYLFEALDQDSDGSISDAERIYFPAEYNQWDFSGDYRYRIRNGENTDVYLWGGVGYLKRDYGFLFTTRNRLAPHTGAGLLFKGESWSLGLNAGLRAVHSPRRNEVLLLDEPDFGVDLNGDLDAIDFFVRSLQLVDRTHTQQKLEVELKTGTTKSLGFEVKLQRRRRHYSSHEAFDVAHVDRTDDRDSARALLAFGEDTGLHAKVGVTYARQKTDRAGDPASTGEISDYRRLGGFFRLTFTF